MVSRRVTLQSNTALLAAALFCAEDLETGRRPDLGSTSRLLSPKARDPSTGARMSFMASLPGLGGSRSSILVMLTALSLSQPQLRYTQQYESQDKLLSLSDHNTGGKGKYVDNVGAECGAETQTWPLLEEP